MPPNLTTEHVNMLSGGLQKYFTEKQNIDIYAVVGTSTFQRTIANAVKKALQSAPPSASVETVLRAAMQDARSILLNMCQAAPPPSPTPTPTPALPQETDPQQDFMSRLAHLETQRRAESSVVSSPPVSENQNQNQSIPASTPTLHSMPPIVVPLPDKRGRIFPITSASREWSYQPDRACFVWPGPLPPRSKQEDASHIALAAIQTPAFVQGLTPFVTVRVTGVGDASASCVFLPQSGSGGGGGKWTTWYPCSPATRFIRHVPTPWTVELLDSFGERVELGADDSTCRLDESMTHVTPSSHHTYGDILRIGTIGRARVGQAPPYIVKILQKQKIGMSGDLPVLNEMMQWCVFLELEGTN